jgi:ubiquinone biosynthesis protein
MSVLEVLSAARDLGRLQEIATTLIRHGLGDVVQTLRLGSLLERAGRVLHWQALANFREMTVPERVRHALEDLGPTFVKFGQVLAARPDLLPPEWIASLSKLLERVEPVPYEALEAQLTADLGAPPEAVFARFDRAPLAAGSLAQVHTATTKGGEEVVLKIRRPDIEHVVESDLRLLARLAEIVENELPNLRRYRPKQLVRHFARTMRAELDFELEARHTELIRSRLREGSGVRVPRVLAEYSRVTLLVLERFHGVSASEWLANKDVLAVDGPLLARRGADALLRMVFEDGVYHADPHPGNVMFLSADRIGLLDCGMIGYLSDERRREFLGLLVASFQRDETRAAEVLVQWSGDDQDVDLELLTQDCRAFIDRWHSTSLGRVDTSALITDILEIIRGNDLFMPPDVSSLLRVFTLVDGLGRSLDPRFDLTEQVDPIVRRAIARHHSLRHMLRRHGGEIAALLGELPKDTRTILSRLRRGRFGMRFDIRQLDDFARQVNQSANRLTMGMVTAALIVGTAIGMTVDGGPTLFGLPVIAFIGFISSVGVGIGLLWSIARSGRR